MYDGGADVTGYVVEILEEGSEQWYRATTKALKTNQYVAAGLAANKKYQFRVAAVNSNGTGEFSEPSAEVEPLEKVGESVLLSAAEHQVINITFLELALGLCEVMLTTLSLEAVNDVSSHIESISNSLIKPVANFAVHFFRNA